MASTRALPGQPPREWGYFVLEDCSVDIVFGGANVADASLPGPKQWVPVKAGNLVGSARGSRDESVERLGSEAKEDDDEPASKCLPLFLGEAGQLECRWDAVPFFDGYLPPADQKINRDDSLLLLGLLRAVHPTVTVCSIKIMLFGREKRGVADSTTHRFSAALIVTAGFPFLEQQRLTNRRILPPTSKMPSPSLAPSMQLVLSMIRSNWPELEWIEDNIVAVHQRVHARRDLVEKRVTRVGRRSVQTRRPSVFPHQLTLPDLYESIQECVMARQVDYQSNSDPASELLTLLKEYPKLITDHIAPFLPAADLQAWRGTCRKFYAIIPGLKVKLFDFSPELVTDHIAPFLRAVDLDAWRSTCRYFHSLLKAIVPGLKGLKDGLFQHQVASLAWMRSRECRQLSEGDVLKPTGTTAAFSPQDAFSPVDTDAHRTVTGGQTALLTLRPVRDNEAVVHVRLDQMTGIEVQDDEFAKGHRQVCRGGLLCDDPGLGKTITVLALILQTYGQRATTADDRMPPDAPMSASKSPDDVIFDAYWAEDVVPDLRRPALLSIANKLARCAPRGCPLRLESVLAEIQRDAYGDSFDAFDDKMRYGLISCSIYCASGA
jgi:SNF2-related domain